MEATRQKSIPLLPWDRSQNLLTQNDVMCFCCFFFSGLPLAKRAVLKFWLPFRACKANRGIAGFWVGGTPPIQTKPIRRKFLHSKHNCVPKGTGANFRRCSSSQKIEGDQLQHGAGGLSEPLAHRPGAAPNRQGAPVEAARVSARVRGDVRLA